MMFSFIKTFRSYIRVWHLSLTFMKVFNKTEAATLLTTILLSEDFTYPRLICRRCLKCKHVLTDNMCPLMSVSNAVVNTSACLADGVCQTGTVLEYSCSGEYTISTPITVCLANQSWSHRPLCIKPEDG